MLTSRLKEVYNRTKEHVFEAHPRQNGHESYEEYREFAGEIALKLLVGAGFFGLHAVLPVLPVPKGYNLESVTSWLVNKNVQAEIKRRVRNEQSS